MSNPPPNHIDPEDLASFRAHLNKSTRIVALLGAGLSASSGLPTFRGAGGYWRTHDATSLATPEAFADDPSLVWQFYNYRRHMALNARPNLAHLALAELAFRKPQFLTLSQNVDGLSPRAGHPARQLKLLHGNLFDLKCWDQQGCGYVEPNCLRDPVVPALAIPAAQERLETALATGAHDAPEDSSSRAADLFPPSSTSPTPHPLIRGQDIADAAITLPPIPPADLPHCPQCHTNLLRPGVVWFGESLPTQVLADIDAYFSRPDPVDLMLVIGTSSQVYPAAGYTGFARHKGARVAVINMDESGAHGLVDGGRDWFFQGDAAVIVPELLRDVIGEVDEFHE